MTYDHTDALRSPMMRVPDVGTTVPQMGTDRPQIDWVTHADIATGMLVWRAHG